MKHNDDTDKSLSVSSFILLYLLFLVSISGQTERRGPHSIPGKEKMFRRIQMPAVQAQVDEREQLGEYWATVHQVLHQRIPAQAETAGQA